MSNSIFDIEVTDRASFAKFIDLLHSDLLQNKNEWENPTLERFLEAMSRYTEDIQGMYNNTNQNVNADQPSWKTFADIFKGSRIYE